LCPGCGRAKIEIIRPSNQFNWLFLLDEVKFADGAIIT